MSCDEAWPTPTPQSAWLTPITHLHAPIGGPQLELGWALTRHIVGSDPASNTPDDAAEAHPPPTWHPNLRLDPQQVQ